MESMTKKILSNEEAALPPQNQFFSFILLPSLLAHEHSQP
jgi:hypothetical protein